MTTPTGPLHGLIGAVQFLTRVPVRLARPVAHERAVPWFPVAGALIGLVVGSVAAATTELLGPSLAATLGVVAGLAVTGAFHEDGLADTADAFGGGWTPEQRLEILKDSRHGTYGVAALVSSVLIRVMALAALSAPATMLAGAVAAHTLARGAAIGALVVFPPAADAGLGAGASRSARRGPIVVGLVAGLAVAVLAVGWWGLPAAAAAGLALVLVGRLAVRKIGGTVGDVLGAIEQVAECAVLVTLAGLARRGDLPWG